MTRKHLDINATPPAPTVIRTFLRGKLNIKFGDKRPEVEVAELSTGRFEVRFEARGEIRGRQFDSLAAAVRYYLVLTGRDAPRGRMVA